MDGMRVLRELNAGPELPEDGQGPGDPDGPAETGGNAACGGKRLTRTIPDKEHLRYTAPS